jgi:hypothetical protein
MPKLAEIIGPDGRVHYRRPEGDPLITQAYNTPGYSVRFVEAMAGGPQTAQEIADVLVATGMG